MFLDNRHRLWFRLLLMLSAISLFILAYQWGNDYQRRHATPPVIGGILLMPPATLPTFALQDTRGQTVDQDVLSKGWTLMAFGDLARASGQLAIHRLIDLHGKLADQRALLKTLRLVLVTPSVAPHLARDFARLSPALLILGDEAGQAEQFRQNMGLGAEETSSVFVIGPGGYVLAFLPDTQTGTAMADDVKAIHANAFQLIPEQP